MATYISLARFTQQGIENIKESPERLDAAKELFKSMGSELKEFYLVTMRFLSAVTPRTPLAIGTVVVLGACTPQPPVDIEAQTAALREAIQAYEEAGANVDVEGMLGLYAVGGAMLPPNGPDVPPSTQRCRTLCSTVASRLP